MKCLFTKTALLCLMLMVLSSFGAMAQDVSGKRITVNLKSASVHEFFDVVKKQTGLNFIMTETKQTLPRITINEKDKPLGDVLDKVMAQIGCSYDISDGFITVYPKQSTEGNINRRLVQGIVKDTGNGLLPGAQVAVKGTDNRTITDANGRYFIMVPVDGCTLEFSFVGMDKKELRLRKGTQPVFQDITMDSSNELDDVVITGYQQIDRRNLTSAVTSVRMEDLQIPGYTDLNQMLEGKIPDMVVTNNSGEMNATPKLRIRGTSTLIGNREPLWVVDGIIVTDPVNLSPDVLNDPDYVNRIGNAISGINPQDIERLDVLKDAAATALYGTRAANGVIVVTTKKGRVGKPVISYSATATGRRRPRYGDSKVDLMNSQERIQFSQQLVENHYLYPSGIPLTGYEYALQRLYNGELNAESFETEVNRLQTMNTDWFDILTHDSFSHDHTLNVSGGTEKVRYYASLGYSDGDDVIKNTTNRRYTASTNIDMTLSNKWRLGFKVNGYLNDRENTQINTINYAYNTSRAIPAYNEDGSYHYYGVRNILSSYLNYNVLNELDNSYNTQNTTGATVTANLMYDPAEWIHFIATVSANFSNASQESYYGERTNYAAKLRRSEYGVEPESDSQMPHGGELTLNNTRTKAYTARLQANISHAFDKNGYHVLGASIGTEISSNHYNGVNQQQRGYYAERGKSFITDISMSDYPSYFEEYLRSNVPTITDNLTNLVSAYATASYSYKRYFTLNANTRYDGSNKFGDRSNEKLLPVWSVSAMTDLKEVTGLNADWIDGITLKGSYGEQGNMLDGQTPTMILRKGSYSSYYSQMVSTVANNGFANPDLKWEKTHSSNIALETSMFHHRLSLHAEYYYKKTTDAFMSKTISDVNGFSSYTINSGTVVNRGYNFDITSTPIKLKDFNWILSGSLSKIMNEMRTAPGAETYELSDFLNGTAVVQGQPIGTFYSYRFVGLSPVDGGPLFDDWEDRRTELEAMDNYTTYTTVLTPSGRREPDITGNINNTFNYKNWRLNISMVYNLGAKTRLFRVMSDFVGGYSSEMNVNRELLNAWKRPGDELKTNIPAIMGTSSPGYYYYSTHWSSASGVATLASNSWTMYDYSDLRVVSGNYLKLNNVSLTYEFPVSVLKKLGMSRLALTASAANLHTFCSSKLKGQTPTQGGFSEVQLSDTPSYTFGLNVNF